MCGKFQFIPKMVLCYESVNFRCVVCISDIVSPLAFLLLDRFKPNSYIKLRLIHLFIVFNSTFSNISAISWQPVLVPGENQRPWTSNW